MVQTALRAQIMLRTATPRLPPEAISYGGCRADGARHALCPSGECAPSDLFEAEVSASLQQQFDPATGIPPRKADGRIQYVGSLHLRRQFLSQRLPSPEP